LRTFDQSVQIAKNAYAAGAILTVSTMFFNSIKAVKQ